MNSRALLIRGAAALVLIAVVVAVIVSRPDQHQAAPFIPAPVRTAAARTLAGSYEIRREQHPARTVLRSAGRTVATLTDGARTVLLTGPERTFTDGDVTIRTTSWVRVAPRRWTKSGITDPGWAAWIATVAGDPSPDVLAAAADYLNGYPLDAEFGIERGDTVDGADFHEYLGIGWDFPEGHRSAAPRWKGALDCSGYLRMVYGYRSGIPLHTGPADREVDGLPRTADAMAKHARQVTIAAGTTRAPKSIGAVQPGDLVFFALRDDPARATHSGIYLGDDVEGRPRFVSSRRVSRGPGFADYDGTRSTLDEPAFAESLRRIIRL